MLSFLIIDDEDYNELDALKDVYHSVKNFLTNIFFSESLENDSDIESDIESVELSDNRVDELV